jgi:hypothetical protein
MRNEKQCRYPDQRALRLSNTAQFPKAGSVIVESESD